jgi:D-lyxose ketol-isomerase
MKRSEINTLVRDAQACFAAYGWALPPRPRWDVTDFGLGDWRQFGLVLINLAEEPEYCEKLMYAKAGMTTPMHCHRVKKEDIICRAGALKLIFEAGGDFEIKVNGEMKVCNGREEIVLQAGERVTITPGIFHEFSPVSAECIIGEVSTANDDATDNVFTNPDIGRFPDIEADEPPIVNLVSDLLP